MIAVKTFVSPYNSRKLIDNFWLIAIFLGKYFKMPVEDCEFVNRPQFLKGCTVYTNIKRRGARRQSREVQPRRGDLHQAQVDGRKSDEIME